MKQFKSIIILMMCLFHTCYFPPLASSPYPGIPDDDWQKIVPHLVTNSHPAKASLDQLFEGNRDSVYDLNALLNMGFYFPQVTGRHVYTFFHKQIPGYLIKVFRPGNSTFQPSGNDWQSWLLRIQGAELVRQEIKAIKGKKIFSVPKKWIYALPPDTSREDPVNFILVAEDMNLATKKQNLKYYQRNITRTHLKGIFHIVTKIGLSDGCSHDNLIWTKDKKLAFVDTEAFHNWPVHYHRMKEYVTPSMRKWWKSYVKSKGEDPSY